MHNRNWPTYHPLFVIVTLLASVTIAASSGRQRQLTGDPSNLRSNQLALINYDDSDTSADTSALSSQDSVETVMETYKVPKRTLSLFTRWKTLEQLRRNHLHPSPMAVAFPMESSDLEPPPPPPPTHQRHQQKKIPNLPSKTVAGKEEMMALAGMSNEMSLSARAIQRSLRPPGQPLRWG